MCKFGTAFFQHCDKMSANCTELTHCVNHKLIREFYRDDLVTHSFFAIDAMNNETFVALILHPHWELYSGELFSIANIGMTIFEYLIHTKQTEKVSILKSYNKQGPTEHVAVCAFCMGDSEYFELYLNVIDSEVFIDIVAELCLHDQSRNNLIYYYINSLGVAHMTRVALRHAEQHLVNSSNPAIIDLLAAVRLRTNVLL